jgi:hypothetical protein
VPGFASLKGTEITSQESRFYCVFAFALDSPSKAGRWEMCYWDVDLCRDRLVVTYSESGVHSSGWKSGLRKCAVL